jgi:PAS domain S-box-containing protein
MELDLVRPEVPPPAGEAPRPGSLATAEHYRSVFQAMRNGLAYCRVLTDGPRPHDFVYVEVNDAFEAQTGLTNVVGKKASEVIPGIREEDPELLDIYSEVARSGRPARFERYVKALGEWFAVSVCSPAPDHFVAVFDVTTKTRIAEEALRASEAKYRRLFDSLMDGFVLVDMDGVIRESNEVYRRMLGYSAEELARVTYQDLTPERWHPIEARIVAEQILPRGFSDVYEKEYRRKDGTVFPVELRTVLLREEGRPVAMWAIVRDVGESRRMRTKLAVASRMAALGTLVSGVAHEINNPLAAEMADQGVALEVVREVRDHLGGDAPLDRDAERRALDSVVEALEDAQEGGAKIAGIVKDLALFGKPDAKRQRTRLTDVAEGAMRWLPASVTRSASVRVEDRGAPDVIASAGQIEQVLVNLITNAAKATPEGQRGVVVVRIGPGRPGTARVEVVDHGVGVAPAIRDHIFDPFFTTRSTGAERGTGLGLAICQAIAVAHGGSITFESEVGQGSTFRLELPAAPVEG